MRNESIYDFYGNTNDEDDETAEITSQETAINESE